MRYNLDVHIHTGNTEMSKANVADRLQEIAYEIVRDGVVNGEIFSRDGIRVGDWHLEDGE